VNKNAASATVFISMLFLGVGMVLSRGWVNDFQAFVQDKVGGSSVTPTNTPQTPSSNNPANAPHPAGGGGGGGSW
jgi:hypothetical protein